MAHATSNDAGSSRNQHLALIEKIASNTHTTDDLITFTRAYLKDHSFADLARAQFLAYTVSHQPRRAERLQDFLTRIKINSLEAFFQLSGEQTRLSSPPGAAAPDQEQLYNGIINGTATAQQKASFQHAILHDILFLKGICHLRILHASIPYPADLEKAMRLHRELQPLGIGSVTECEALLELSDAEIARRYPPPSGQARAPTPAARTSTPARGGASPPQPRRTPPAAGTGTGTGATRPARGTTQAAAASAPRPAAPADPADTALTTQMAALSVVPDLDGSPPPPHLPCLTRPVARTPVLPGAVVAALAGFSPPAPPPPPPAPVSPPPMRRRARTAAQPSRRASATTSAKSAAAAAVKSASASPRLLGGRGR